MAQKNGFFRPQAAYIPDGQWLSGMSGSTLMKVNAG
jgi:hypothetical protein